jgi:peptidoglycan/LPS O-acetylase OafA/YrhL
MASRMTSRGQSGAPAIQRSSDLDPTADRPFFTRVESLRGLGALAVAGYHLSACSLHGVPLLPETPWDGVGTLQSSLGRIGFHLFPAHAALMMFFVISGFVLRVSLGHGPERVPAAASKFLLGRIFRIYPVVTLGLLLIAAFGGAQVSSPGQPAQPLTAPRFIANLLLLDVSMNSVLWALQVEMLMAPVLLFLYLMERRLGPRVILGMGLLTTALPFCSSHWAVWPPLSVHLFPFVLGTIVPTLGRRVVMGLSKRAATCWTAAGVLALLLTRPCLGLFSRCSAIIEAYAAVGLVSLVAYRLDVPLLKCLDAKALRLLGLSSGSYYVLHLATVPAALAIASVLIPPHWSAEVPALVSFVVLPTWLIAMMPLTVCSYYLVEAPGIALGRRLIRFLRLESRTAAGLGTQRVVPRIAA